MYKIYWVHLCKMSIDNILGTVYNRTKLSNTSTNEPNRRKQKMKKFEVGKKYIIGHVEFVGDVTVEVISRTEKFVTIKKFRETKRLKIKDWGNREVAFWGDDTIDALDEKIA